LDPGNFEGQQFDWWFVASTPFGLFSYKYPPAWVAGISTCLQMPLFNFSNYQLYNSPLPAEGAYVLYFGVDKTVNGSLDEPIYDSISINYVSKELGGPDSNPPEECVNRCKDLSGNIEMQVLVGPADAVGLKPSAVGNIPFSTQCDDKNYCPVQGGGSIIYEDIYEAVWGTYTVTLDMDVEISGECDDGDAASLRLTVEASGEQLIQVRSEGVNADYPWSGTHTMDLTFPLEEGATAEGEGWVFVLHLD